jgi:hypothetical protein
MMMSADQRLLRAPTVLLRYPLRGVLLRPRGREPVLLDGSGWLVWESLTAEPSLEGLAQLATLTNESVSTIVPQVRRVVDDLVRVGAPEAA